MPDVVGYRAKMGVIVPSTNTVVEHDYSAMRPHGVTFHTGRAYITEPDIDSDVSFEDLLQAIRDGQGPAIRDVMTCKPDYMIMGMSAETFWGGAEGNRKFEAEIREQTGLGVTTGATACKEALALFGARRIACVSPYPPVGDQAVTKFFEDHGHEVVRFKGLAAPSATGMAAIKEDALADVLRELDGPDVDAIVQVGTNLSMVRLADAAERWLKKPVIAINAACVWHALRANGFEDKLEGFGSLLREH
jgi:maleate isomerase